MVIRQQIIAETIEGWMRSDGFIHRHSSEIFNASPEEQVRLAAEDCAYFVNKALTDYEENWRP